MSTKMDDYTEGHAKQNASPSIQWTVYGLRAVKTYGNAESRVGRKEDFWRQQMAAPKVVTKEVPQHALDKFRSEAAKTNDNAEDCAKGI